MITWMTDYSMWGESTAVLKHISFGHLMQAERTCIEIGALDGIRNSNTRMLLEMGWRGWMYEPNPASHTKCVENTRRLDVEVLRAAVGKRFGHLRFQPNTRIPGHSRIDSKGEIEVLMVPIMDVLADFHMQLGPLLFLSVDAEGCDPEIAEGISQLPDEILPHFLVIEAATAVDLQVEILALSDQYRLVEIFGNEKVPPCNLLFERLPF